MKCAVCIVLRPREHEHEARDAFTVMEGTATCIEHVRDVRYAAAMPRSRLDSFTTHLFGLIRDGG